MEAAVAELAGGADEALAYVQSLLPSHREDMALVEKLEELTETARRKVCMVAGRKVDCVKTGTHEARQMQNRGGRRIELGATLMTSLSHAMHSPTLFQPIL